MPTEDDLNFETYQILEPSTNQIFRDGSWDKFPHKFALRTSYMSKSAITVFLFLLTYINKQNLKDTGEAIAWPGYELIEGHLRIDRRTLQRSIKELLQLGYIREKRFDFPPYNNPHETNQKVWMFVLGEIEDDTEFKKRALEFSGYTMGQGRKNHQKF